MMCQVGWVSVKEVGHSCVLGVKGHAMRFIMRSHRRRSDIASQTKVACDATNG
jgi:hypothetical protein